MNKLLLASVCLVCVGQSFEVASIHLHTGVVKMTGRTPHGPLVTFDAMTPAELIAEAFDIRDFQLEGGPAWLKSDRYDISARTAGDSAAPLSDIRRMEQTLLAERFHLQFHRASREIPVYALVPAKSGHKLKPNETGNGTMLFRNPTREAPTDVIASSVTLDRLARTLSGIPGIDRPILDRTGLTGKYDFKLTLLYTFLADKSGRAATGPEGESVFTTIEEQLGLKLDQQRLPVETFVVDALDRPSEN